MDNVEEKDSLMSHLFCCIEAMIIDWDDAESCDMMERAFQRASLEAPVGSL